MPRHPSSNLPMPSYERLESVSPEVKGESESQVSQVSASEAEGAEVIGDEQHPGTAFQMSIMASKMLDCENCEAGFYEKLTTLKQQNIQHLQTLEHQLKGGLSKC